jgi:hypothetical protein
MTSEKRLNNLNSTQLYTKIISTIKEGHFLPLDYIITYNQKSLEEKYSTRINFQILNERREEITDSEMTDLSLETEFGSLKKFFN